MKKFLKFFLNALLIISLASCAPGGGTTTGNPVTVDMRFEAYNSALLSSLRRLFIKDAFAGIATLEVCFKRMRLKLENGSIGGNVDLELGRVSIDPTGTPLGLVEVQDALYKRVEFDLDDNCEGSGSPSVYIVNDHGAFSTQDSITIKFEGSFRPSEEDLIMAIQSIVDKAKTVMADGEIRTKLESVSGSLPSP